MDTKRFFFTLFLVSLTQSTTSFPESCKTNAECGFYAENSVCSNGTCQCQDKNILSGDGAKCLEVASGIEGTCQDDVQCSTSLNSGGICENNVCKCANGFHYLRGKCWKNVPLNSACFLEEQCYAAFDFVGVTCVNEKCVCREEYYERGGACRRKLSDGSVCLVDSDCFCNQGKCQGQKCKCVAETATKSDLTSKIATASLFESTCEPGYYEKDGNCVSELGAYCEKLEQCDVTNSVCIDSRECGCADGRMGSANNRLCNKVAIDLGSTCTDNGQCASFGENGICSLLNGKRTCSCLENTHYDSTAKLCRFSKLIGETCDVDNDCVAIASGNVKCNSGICKCVDGCHEADGGKGCRPDGIKVGDTCVEASDCLLENSRCDADLKTCQCNNNYFSNGTFCVSGIGSGCSESSTCLSVDGASCVVNKCACSEGVSSGDWSKCLPVVDANEKCSETVQCSPSMGDLKECKNNVCVCLDNAQYILDKCFAIIKLGEKCKARAECVYPGSNPDGFMCQNGLCACRYGYQRNGDDCV